MHATKLPLRLWLTAMWLILQSDKGISSVRLAEAVGVSQPTAWRMGHALRLLMSRQQLVSGTVEIDDLYVGGAPRMIAGRPRSGRPARGQRRTSKTPVLSIVQRPLHGDNGAHAGVAHACVVENLSAEQTDLVLSRTVEKSAHLISDEAKAFVLIGRYFANHDTVCHSKGEFSRGSVHANSVEGFNDRVRRTITGVFHHISPGHTNLYLNEIGFRWSQRVVCGRAVRSRRTGGQRVQTLWARITPAHQLSAIFKPAVGCQLRRTNQGSIRIKSCTALFG